MRSEYFSLLKEWCDSLLRMQVTENQDPSVYGGILCPSCARIHGRCADAIHPMMYLYHETGEEKYLNSAKLLFNWADNNMTRPDGSFVNDTNSAWRGITVFFSIQLGETLLYYGDLLDPLTRRRWTERLDRCAAFLSDFMPKANANANYPITCSASLAIAGRILENEQYKELAKKMAHEALDFFSPEGLIFGEGHPAQALTAKGCRPVDLGYNVEESLPGLYTYAEHSGDEEILEKIMASMEEHLQFMLPDGAWDNSWGNRSNKWTYWGSRTSDGCQVGYAPLAKRNPLFGEAAQRNFELYRACTHGGWLHGGPMYAAAGEPPCAHHTFCHAKALTAMCECGFTPPSPRLPLPRETAKGLRYYPTPRAALLAEGPWRATVADHDFEYVQSGHAKGGALTMLWHQKAGPICAASMTEYTMVEANNMQLPQYYQDICQTPRIEYQENGVWYRSINDCQASMETEEGAVAVHAAGVLRDGAQNGSRSYNIRYEAKGEDFCFCFSTDAKDAVYCLPIIAAESDPVSVSGNCARIRRGNETIVVEAGVPVELRDTPLPRVFNPVGGFQAVHLLLKLEAGKETAVRIHVE
ncbi:MAG: hypothetical protein HFG26_03760 [Provencibacterium sp.]|jgi:hypothetical protein|nr:hypothetical protein [Provencibacterium sp.]